MSLPLTVCFLSFSFYYSSFSRFKIPAMQCVTFIFPLVFCAEFVFLTYVPVAVTIKIIFNFCY
jgi:hypothetical protein